MANLAKMHLFIFRSLRFGQRLWQRCSRQQWQLGGQKECEAASGSEGGAGSGPTRSARQPLQRGRGGGGPSPAQALFPTGRVSDPDIHLIRIRIQNFRLNTDPDPGFWWPKNCTKFTAEIFFYFFGSKTTIYLSLGLHKGRPSYRRSLQLSKENIHHCKHEIFKFFLLLRVIFALLTWLNPDPIRIRTRIRNPSYRSRRRWPVSSLTAPSLAIHLGELLYSWVTSSIGSLRIRIQIRC